MNVPIPSEITNEEKRIAEIQIGFATRLRKSPYYIVEKTKTTGESNYCGVCIVFSCTSRIAAIF